MLNRLMSRDLPQVPEAGMGATRLMWSDRVAGTITQIVELGGRVTAVYFREDVATRTDSNEMSDSQRYEYSPNPAAAELCYTLRKDGTYVRQGAPMKNGERLMIGARMQYHDFSF